MITGEMKNKVDSIWDTIWTGGITSPITVLEQITYLMFMKLLDDNQLKAEANANLLGVQLKSKVFQDGICVISENPKVETEYKNLRCGENGQFRTPRHIINMMVELMQPTLKDYILDPAMGSAGFLLFSVFVRVPDT